MGRRQHPTDDAGRIAAAEVGHVGDSTGGAKVLGKQGAWTFAALNTQGDLAGSTTGANYTVARVRRDVASRSNVGFLLANRMHDGRNQGSAEIDANLFFTQTFGFTGQFVKSYGEYGAGSAAFFACPAYDLATAHVRYTHLGDRFAHNVNAIGFIRDDDRRELDGAIEKTFWIRSGRVERVQYTIENNIYWGQTGVLRSWEGDQALSVDWRNRWTTAFRHAEEFKRFEKDFRNRQTQLELGYNTRSYESVSGGYTFGRNFDADFQLWTGAATYTLTEELSAEYELQRLDLDPDPRDESTWIHVIRANQFFTPDLFLRVFFQTNSAIDRRNVQAVFSSTGICRRSAPCRSRTSAAPLNSVNVPSKATRCSSSSRPCCSSAGRSSARKPSRGAEKHQSGFLASRSSG